MVSQQRRAIYERRQALIDSGDPAGKVGHQSQADPDIERAIILGIIDAAWREHLNFLDGLREGTSLVHHAQKDPLLEFRRSASLQFEEMQRQLEWALVEEFPRQLRRYLDYQRQRELAAGLVIPEANPPEPAMPVSRNALCPCGSARKYKRCHGRSPRRGS